MIMSNVAQELIWIVVFTVLFSHTVSSAAIGGTDTLSCVPNDDISQIPSSANNAIQWRRTSGSTVEDILVYSNTTGSVTYGAGFTSSKYTFDTALFRLNVSSLEEADCSVQYQCSSSSGYSSEALSITCIFPECGAACITLFALACVFAGPIFGLGPVSHWYRRKYGSDDKRFIGMFIVYVMCGSLAAILGAIVVGLYYDAKPNLGRTAIGWPMAAAAGHMLIMVPIIWLCPRKTSATAYNMKS